MTRIPAATRRQHVEVRASRTGPKLPSLHALARHGLRGSLRVLQLKKHNRFGYRLPDLNVEPSACRWNALRSRLEGSTVRFGYRLPDLNVEPSTDRRKGFLPALNDRVSTLGVSR